MLPVATHASGMVAGGDVAGGGRWKEAESWRRTSTDVRMRGKKIKKKL